MFSGDAVGIVLLACLALLVVLWGLRPLWRRPLGSTRRPLSRSEHLRVTIGVIVLVLALGAAIALTWLHHVSRDFARGFHE